MNIIIFSRGYPHKRFNLNGIFEFDQALALSQNGHKVIFCFIDFRSIRRIRKWGFESLTKAGIDIRGINIPIGGISDFILANFGKIAAKFLLNRVIKEFGKPDLIHAHFIKQGSYVADYAKNNNLPFILTEHSSSLLDCKSQISFDNLVKNTYSATSALIAVSPSLKEIIKTKYGYNSVYVPNVVNTDLFFTDNAAKSDDFIFISVANLNLNKRTELLIRAFAKAFDASERIILKIIGDGPERLKLDSLIKEKNMVKKILLLGEQPRDIVATNLAQADCFVLASKHETFGVVYIEAMASGLPVIATKSGGPEHFINEFNGKLVETDNIDELIDALRFMYINARKYDRNKIKSYTKSEFGSKKLVERLENVYSKVLNNIIK